MADEMDTPEPDDLPAAEPAEKTKRLTRAKMQALAKENRQILVAHQLSTRLGRRFVWEELSEGGLFRLSFSVGDSHLTAFNEGRRDRANRLFGEIMAEFPEQYALMAAEARDDARV